METQNSGNNSKKRNSKFGKKEQKILKIEN